MKTNKTRTWRKWMALLAVASALTGSGVADAMNKECWQCAPCGCGTDGGHLLCCGSAAC